MVVGCRCEIKVDNGVSGLGVTLIVQTPPYILIVISFLLKTKENGLQLNKRCFLVVFFYLSKIREVTRTRELDLGYKIFHRAVKSGYALVVSVSLSISI